MTVLPYKLMDIIGKGSHGKVYRAYDAFSDKMVAIKITPKTIAAVKEVEMIQTMQKCRHVVKYIEHFEFPEEYAIVMEEIVGVDGNYMLEFAKHGIYLTEQEIRGIALPLCQMVHDCHKHSILYGDMKPANYMFTPPSKVTIVDFGCTRKGVHFTTPLGTPLYFSPQKFQKSYGLKSDVWGIGIVLYELICGHHPFAATKPKSPDMLFEQLISTPLLFDHPQWDNMSPTLRDLIHRTLDKHEETRISAKELLEHPWWNIPL